MALYNQKWWKRIFKRKEETEKVDAIKDTKAILDFLQETGTDINMLTFHLQQLQDLEKEFSVTSKELQQTNVETQAEVLDKILERYQFFQTDVDINGLRVKKITTQFLKTAKEAGLQELVDEKKKDLRWSLFW
ncbi:MAG: hypothetical protein Q8R37_00855 [Nanoarchaeota archaeon]|nr:hypothetical protein [Nanoarchaeota archaeon]